jgi:hypothetical protein
VKIDLRSVGTLVFLDFHLASTQDQNRQSSYALPAPLRELEPALRALDGSAPHFTALFVKERCVILGI